MYRSVRRGLPDRALRGLRRAVLSRWLPAVLVAGVALDDAFLIERATNYTVLGLLDEPAHLATSLVLLGAAAALAAFRGDVLPRGFAVALVLAGNLIDVDHVPAVLGSEIITAGTPRPYSHSLLTLLLLATGAVVARSTDRARAAAVFAGALVGVTGHLLRDLATAPVALLWPVDDRGFMIPHPAYLALLAVAALVAGFAPPARSGGAGGPGPGPGHGSSGSGGRERGRRDD